VAKRSHGRRRGGDGWLRSTVGDDLDAAVRAERCARARFHIPKSRGRLEPGQKRKVRAFLRRGPGAFGLAELRTLAHVAALIAREFGVRNNSSQVSRLLRALGYAWR
jgi:transposase